MSKSHSIYSFIGMCVFMLLVTMTTASAEVGTYEQTIYKPHYEGYPVNFCLYAGKDCGKIAANRYCESRGFQSAMSFQKGLVTASKYMTTAKICQGRGCSSFEWVRCVGLKQVENAYTIPSEYRDTKLLQHPLYLGTLLDSCSHLNAECAWRTAHKYCKSHGFNKAAGISRWRDAGPTTKLSGHAICQGRKGCHAYHWIRCKRYARA